MASLFRLHRFVSAHNDVFEGLRILGVSDALMRTRAQDTRGFTLAELLIAIAILVVLAAIALPAVLSIQKNMHFVELENGAAQIAQAAQNQMTSKKISGSWLAMLDEDEANYDSQKAKNLPANTKSPDDIYYMTAAQAKQNGILPRNSIDDTVWNGDFVIEYSRSTATVFSVFYSDGKGGFFGAQTTGTPAQTYYDQGGSRDRNTRLNHNPAIGYYQGTPAGATNTVALERPVIWVSSVGELCVQNPNLLNIDRSWMESSIQKVTFTKMDSEGKETDIFFGLDNLQNKGTLSYTIFLGSTESPAIFPEEGNKNVTLEARDKGAVNDTFVFNLEGLLVYLKAMGGDYAVIANQFMVDDNIRVDAEVRTAPSERACVPAKATAFMKFPTLIERLNVYVTDPMYVKEGQQGSVNGTYTAPKTEAKLKNGDIPINGIQMSPTEPMVHDITLSDYPWNNPAAAYQAYDGKYINFSDTDDQMWVETTVGSYTSAGSTAHAYQIFELWINSTKVGYLYNNNWTWEYPQLASCITGLDQADHVSNVPTTIHIDPTLLQELLPAVGIDKSATGGYDLYVRTTPRLSEVEQYWRTWANSQASGIASNARYSARSLDATSQGMAAAFENEFGASSSVASWTVSKETQSGITGYPDNGNDVRIFYAGTPAIGFVTQVNQANQLESDAYIARNTALWLYKSNNGSYAEKPRAMMRNPRTVDTATSYRLTFASSSGSYPDFSLSSTNDALFYRVLFYYQAGSYTDRIADLAPQYIPYSVQDDSAISSFATRPDPSGGLFQGWDTLSTSSAWTGVFRCQKGGYVGQYVNGVPFYDNNLALGRVNLSEKDYNPDLTDTLGVVYYEWYSDGTFGIYGYVDTITPLSTLTDKTITRWGYWLLGDSQRGNNSNPNLILPGKNPINLGGSSTPVKVNGVEYKAYDLIPTLKNNTTTGSTITCSFKWNQGNVTAAYSLNINFAQMVNNEDTNSGGALNWGKEGGDPWKIRHYDQFLGSLDPNLYPNYRMDNFLQTHDLDFKGQTRKPAYRIVASAENLYFTGSYDGNGYLIKNFTNLSSSENGSSDNSPGLFWRLKGTKNKPAVLKNITLDYSSFSANSLSTTITGNAPFNFGMLSSSAEYARIEKCTVDGAVGQGASAQPMQITVDAGWGEFNMGGLLGTAENCVIDQCEVRDIKLISKTARGSGIRLKSGSLVGYVKGIDTRITWNALAPKTYAQNVVLRTPTGGTILMGGLVGSNAADVSAVNWTGLQSSFTNVTSEIGATTTTLVAATGGTS